MNGTVSAIRIGTTAERILKKQSHILKIHSVFKHALNFIDNGDYLVTILEDSHGASSQVITISPRDFTKLISKGLMPGEYVDIRNLIDLECARVISPVPPSGIRYLPRFQVLKNIEMFREYIIIHGNISGFGASLFKINAIFEKFTSKPLMEFRRAYRMGDEDKMTSALGSLIGLGSGLTPSGDDFICGLFSVLLYYFGLKGLDNEHLKKAGRYLTGIASAGTNIISYNMLRACFGGELSESVMNLLESIMTQTERKLEECAARVLSAGNTSGCDTAVGILYGLELVYKIQSTWLWSGGYYG